MPVTLPPVFPASDQPLTFRSFAGLLRYLADRHPQAGHRRSPARFYLGSRTPDGTVSGFSLHQINRTLGRWRITAEQLDALMRLQQRYAAHLRYRTEVLPDWRDGTPIRYADNSVEVVQTNWWGGTRRRALVAPHGDAC